MSLDSRRARTLARARDVYEQPAVEVDGELHDDLAGLEWMLGATRMSSAVDLESAGHPGFTLMSEARYTPEHRFMVICGRAFRRIELRVDLLRGTRDELHLRRLEPEMTAQVEDAVDKLWSRWMAL